MKKKLLTTAVLSVAFATTTIHAQEATPATAPATEAIATAPAPAARKQIFSTSSPESRANWQRRLTLGPGDTLNFSLYDQPDTVKRDVVIGPDGRVTFLQAEDG